MIMKNKEDIQLAKNFFDKVTEMLPRERLDLATSALTNLVAQICVQGNMSKEAFLGYMGVAYDLNID